MKKSAKRALRRSLKRAERNRMWLINMRNAIRLFRKEVQRLAQEKPDKFDELIKDKLGEVFSIIDKTASKGVIHKRESSRRKSRLARFVNSLIH